MLAAGGALAFGVMRYAENEFARDFHDARLDEVRDSALYALGELGYGRDEDDDAEMFRAGDAAVRVFAHPAGFVRAEVRVGVFSSPEHERAAREILDAIAQDLSER